DPGRGGPQAADDCAQVDVPRRWRPVLPEHLGELLTRHAPAALADQVGQSRSALPTSELGLEEQPATGLQAQPAGDVDADAHPKSEADLPRRAPQIYRRPACLPHAGQESRRLVRRVRLASRPFSSLLRPDLAGRRRLTTGLLWRLARGGERRTRRPATSGTAR